MNLAVQPCYIKGCVVRGTVYVDMHYKDLFGSNCKSKVLYSAPGFLSSATWPIMLKKHSHGFIKQHIIRDWVSCAYTMAFQCGSTIISVPLISEYSEFSSSFDFSQIAAHILMKFASYIHLSKVSQVCSNQDCMTYFHWSMLMSFWVVT